jgi:hypothetical protein
MLSDQDLALLLVWISGTLLVSTVGFAIAWVRARERALRVREDSAPARDAAALKAEGLERSVDSIAVEVERISEGQRFLARLLAERHEPGARSVADVSAQRVITPH